MSPGCLEIAPDNRVCVLITLSSPWAPDSFIVSTVTSFAYFRVGIPFEACLYTFLIAVASIVIRQATDEQYYSREHSWEDKKNGFLQEWHLFWTDQYIYVETSVINPFLLKGQLEMCTSRVYARRLTSFSFLEDLMMWIMNQSVGVWKYDSALSWPFWSSRGAFVPKMLWTLSVGPVLFSTWCHILRCPKYFVYFLQ